MGHSSYCVTALIEILILKTKSPLNNLGIVYNDQGKHEEALKMHERSIEMRQAIYGQDCAHRDIATSRSNLGGVYYDQGKPED